MENEALRVSQASVAQALATDYFCIYYVNTETDRFIQYSASPEYLEFGLPASGDDIIGFSRNNFEKIILPEDRERFLETFTKENIVASLDAHGTFTMTFRMLFRKGPTYVHLKVTRMIEEERRHVVIGISDINEQKMAREAYEKAHHASITYSRIAQALAEDYFCIYYVDMDTDRYIEYGSDSAFNHSGIARSGEDFFNLSRKNVKRIMHEEDQGAFLAVFTKENIQRTLDGHRAFTLSYRLMVDDAPTWVSMKATRLKDGDGNHIIIGVSNIDAQMRQQAEYRQAEKIRITYSRVAQALAGDYFSIYVVDPSTDHFIEYSATEQYDELGIEKSGEDFFNLSRRNIERVIYPGDRDRFVGTFSKEKIMDILERDGSFTMKYRLMFGEEPVYVSMKATLLEDKEGRYLIIGVNNIDAQMRREQEYQERIANARNRAKNDFLTNMSHDIRTPMNAIVGYTNIARARTDVPEPVREILDKIGSSSHFLLSLINDVLDISKIESGKLQLNEEPFDLEAVFKRIEDITSLQADRKSLSIRYDHSGVRHYQVRGDELRIEQVLINIIGNAIKYTPEGKSVSLIAEEALLAEPGRHRYRFIIRDTGMGISEEYLPHIFESFTREQSTTINRIQGTGLGLAISAQVVKLMGGDISVKSKPGEGSEFTVTVDLMSSEDATSEAHAEAANGGSGLEGRRVLLVEDNDINAEIAAMILTQFGLIVERAANGRLGADAVLKAAPGFFDVVLMDIQMPVMNGYEATRAIRTAEGEYFRRLPIIAMSANAYDDDVRACLESGMNAHIAKPFNPEALIALLREYILGV